MSFKAKYRQDEYPEWFTLDFEGADCWDKQVEEYEKHFGAMPSPEEIINSMKFDPNECETCKENNK